ncbi:MAG: hypothetical protein KDA79_16425 [Planctomycetaceae bacterium]|nr:hypothetical protein [Planctomycetaceae bacterium]
MQHIPAETISQAIEILGTNGTDEDQIWDRLCRLVEDPISVGRLFVWPPEAFGYVLISHSWEIGLPETFSACSANGKWHEFELKCEPVFVESVQIATQIYHNGPREVYSKMAQRSALLNSMNNTMEADSPVEGGQLNGPALAGIPAEIYLPSAEGNG